jgi:hypothetical protein
MDIGQGGGRENTDWGQMRRPWTEPKLHGQTSEWVNSLGASIRPIELCRRYPRIANDLCALWDLPHIWERYVEDLLSLDSRRPPRKGFPGDISHELSSLTRYRSLQLG